MAVTKMKSINHNDIQNSVDAFRGTFSKEAKQAIEVGDREFLLNYCLGNRAWKDTVARERFVHNSVIIENKVQIVAVLKDELENNITSICEDFDGWHAQLCNRKDFGMRYGLWQKFVNMTFKNLYCIKEFFPEFNSIWDKCHCPIDSIIAKTINSELVKLNLPDEQLTLSKKVSRSEGTTWNNLTENDYLELRLQIELVCSGYHITPLEFDFAFWND